MTDEDLRKLSRMDLLAILVAQSKENAELKEQIIAARAQLQNKEISIEKAGSLAEAALQLNDVFCAADRACVQFLENIKLRCEKLDAESGAKASMLIPTTEERHENSDLNRREGCVS